MLRWVPLDEVVDAVLDGRLQQLDPDHRGAGGPCPTRLSRLGTSARQLERYLRHVAIERGRSANTVAAYRRDLEAFLTCLAEHGASSMPRRRTHDGRGDRVRPRAARAAASARRVVGRADAVVGARVHALPGRRGRCSRPTRPSRSARPKLPMRLPKALTIEQVEQLLAATDGDELGPGARQGAARAALRDRRARLGGGQPQRRRPDRRRGRPPRSCACSARAASSASCRSAATRAPRSMPTWCGRVRCCRRGAGRRPRSSSGCAGPGCRGRTRGCVIRAAAERAGLRARAVAAQHAALLRDAPAAGRRRRARRAGAARARQRRDDADLHAGDGGRPARRVRDGAPGRALAVSEGHFDLARRQRRRPSRRRVSKSGMPTFNLHSTRAAEASETAAVDSTHDGAARGCHRAAGDGSPGSRTDRTPADRVPGAARRSSRTAPRASSPSATRRAASARRRPPSTSVRRSPSTAAGCSRSTSTRRAR